MSGKTVYDEEDDFVFYERIESLRDLYDVYKPEKACLLIKKISDDKLNIKLYSFNKDTRQYDKECEINADYDENDTKRTYKGPKYGMFGRVEKFGMRRYKKELRGLNNLLFNLFLFKNDLNNNKTIKIILKNLRLAPYCYKINEDKTIHYIDLQSVDELKNFNNKYLHIEIKDDEDLYKQIIKRFYEMDERTEINGDTIQIYYSLNYDIYKDGKCYVRSEKFLEDLFKEDENKQTQETKKESNQLKEIENVLNRMKERLKELENK